MTLVLSVIGDPIAAAVIVVVAVVAIIYRHGVTFHTGPVQSGKSFQLN